MSDRCKEKCTCDVCDFWKGDHGVPTLQSTPDQSVKRDAGKQRWSLLPWRAVSLLVDVLTFGAKKYGAQSWRNVDPTRYDDALGRHLYAWRIGERNDPESGLPHLAHALCNVAFMLELDEQKRGER